MAKVKNMEPVFGLPPVFMGPEAEILPLAGEVNWGMEVFKVEDLRALVGDEKVKMGVVDTGIDPDHPMFVGNYQGSRDFTGSASGARDRHGHGTHCSGTVAGVDPRIGVAAGFPIYHGKGLGDSGSGGSSLYRAIEYCLGEGCEILSCSWGGGSLDAGTDRLLREYAERPEKPWLIFAAGNSGADTRQTDAPGNSLNVLNVAALNVNLTPANFTSSGTKIDTAGPGVNIWSAKPGGGFQQMSGTSMATPFVAGLFGLYRAALKKAGRPIPTIYELRKMMESRSTDTHTPGDDLRTGPGWVTPLLLVLTTTADPPPVEG